jgi:hypothetical protein
VDHAKIRADIKKGLRPQTDRAAKGIYVGLPLTRGNGVRDGLLGSKLSDEEAQEYRFVELQTKAAAITDNSSPAMRISFSSPDQGTRTDRAIEVGSGAPREDTHPDVASHGRQVNRLELAAHETASAGAAPAVPASAAAAPVAAAAAVVPTSVAALPTASAPAAAAPVVASEVPNDAVQAQVAYFKRQVHRLEQEARVAASAAVAPAFESSAPAVSTAVAPATEAPAAVTTIPSRRVAQEASSELVGAVESMMKVQQEVSDRIKTLEESRANPPAPGDTSNRDRPTEKHVKKWFAVAKGRKPDIYSSWDGKHGAPKQVDEFSGALPKTFKKYKHALKWYQENQDSSSSESSSTSDSSSESDSSDDSSTDSSASSSRRHSRKHSRKQRRKQRRKQLRKQRRKQRRKHRGKHSSKQRRGQRQSKDWVAPTSPVDTSEGTANEGVCPGPLGAAVPGNPLGNDT